MIDYLLTALVAERWSGFAVETYGVITLRGRERTRVWEAGGASTNPIDTPGKTSRACRSCVKTQPVHRGGDSHQSR